MAPFCESVIVDYLFLKYFWYFIGMGLFSYKKNFLQAYPLWFWKSEPNIWPQLQPLVLLQGKKKKLELLYGEGFGKHGENQTNSVMFAELAVKLKWCFGSVNYPICISSDDNKNTVSVNWFFFGHQNVQGRRGSRLVPGFEVKVKLKTGQGEK